MADITSYIRAIETAARGEAVRDSIINALRAINEQGTGNADTLDNHDSTYFATAEQVQRLHPTSKLVYINPNEWDSNGFYSFEEDYPSLAWDIQVQPGPDVTVDQLDAIADAMIVAGSQTLNTLRCVGTIPTTAIQVLVLATRKV